MFDDEVGFRVEGLNERKNKIMNQVRHIIRGTLFCNEWVLVQEVWMRMRKELEIFSNLNKV